MLKDFDRWFQAWWDSTNQPLVVIGAIALLLFLRWLLNFIFDEEYKSKRKSLRDVEWLKWVVIASVSYFLIYLLAGAFIHIPPEQHMTETERFFHDLWYYSLYVIIGALFLGAMGGSGRGSRSSNSLDDVGGKGYGGFDDGGE
jgi:uncharacterized membrane protein YgcG